jgi:acyl carrier protein
MNTTLDIIRSAVANYTDHDPLLVTPETKLSDVADSLTLIELFFYIEDATGKKIDPPNPLPATVADLIAFIEAAP